MTDRDDDRLPLMELARGFRKRTWVTTRILAKAGIKFASQNIGLDEWFQKVDEQEAVAAARALVEELDGLKGLMMKFGQMMSYLDGSIPPKAQAILRQLQADSRPMDPETIAAVVHGEFGRPAEELFDSFSRSPFAAASIGQVHLAELGGRKLAVKIQYPGIEPLLNGDLTLISRLSRMALLISPIDGAAVAQELKQRLMEECDYLQEAEHQQRFHCLLRDDPEVSVPRAFRELSGKRVLTSDYVAGLPFFEFASGVDQSVKNRAAAGIYGTLFRSIMHRCTYNADPHPGNYLFSADGHVTLLDFGCVKHFDPDFIDVWKRLALSIVDDDRVGFRKAWIDAGFVGRKRGFDFDHQWDAMCTVYQPMRSKEPFRFTSEFVRLSNDAISVKNKNRFKMGLPPDWLFVNRLNWGLFSILARLDACCDFRSMFREAIESPTEPLYLSPVDWSPTSALPKNLEQKTAQ